MKKPAPAAASIPLRDQVEALASMPPYVPSTPEEIAARRAERRARIDAAKANPPPPKVSYATLYKQSDKKPSTLEKPAQFVREFLDENFDKISRKDALVYFVAAGINMSTARTMYQRYHSKRKANVGE